jgi:hypothetical protein
MTNGQEAEAGGKRARANRNVSITDEDNNDENSWCSLASPPPNASGRVVKRGKLKVWTVAVPAMPIAEAVEHARWGCLRPSLPRVVRLGGSHFSLAEGVLALLGFGAQESFRVPTVALAIIG